MHYHLPSPFIVKFQGCIWASEPSKF